MVKNCIDCGKEIGSKALRCSHCHMINYNKSDKNKFFSEEHRKKISEARTGRKASEETRNKISKAHKGIIRTESWRNNLSNALKGRTFTEETKIKMGKSRKKLYAEGKIIPPNLGKRLSEETKNKIRNKNLGKICSEQTKMKISIATRGRKLSEEHKRKIGLSHVNKPAPWATGENSFWFGKKRPDLIERNKKMDLKMEKNPNWQGGKSFEPYPITFNNEFKNLVRLRDNFCCLNCGISEQKHIILFGSRLVSHHIDYIKESTYLQNCCALCHKCNLLANYNRPHWTKFFQSLLSERYGYKYDELGNVIIELVKETQ